MHLKCLPLKLNSYKCFILPQVSQLIERGMQQPISAEMLSLLSAESFKVACSSVLKEMAVNCDLTDLEEVLLLGKSFPLFSCEN